MKYCFLVFLLLTSLLQSQGIRSLMPYPKTAWEYKSAGDFTISQITSIVVPDTTTPAIDKAANYLKSEIQRRLGVTLQMHTLSWYVMSLPPFQSPSRPSMRYSPKISPREPIPTPKRMLSFPNGTGALPQPLCGSAR